MTTRKLRLTRAIAVLEPGGAQLSALRLTLALREHGVETNILAGHATPEGLALYARAGLEVSAYGGDASLQYACDDGFAGWLEPRLRRADLVHAHMFGAWWAAAQAADVRTPLVASEHNTLRWPTKPCLAEMAQALDRVDLFYAHGRRPAHLVRSLGFPPARMRTGLSPIGRPALSVLPNLPVPRVAFVGRLHHEKGPDLLLEALALLEAPPHTVFVGCGPMETELRLRAARLGLRGHVTFAGWHDDPAPFVLGAAAVVVPSRYDAWSQSAVLGMASRTPVIAAEVEGLPEVVARGRGVLVPRESPVALAEAIEGVAAGRLLPDLDAAEGYARRFVPERVAAGYAAEYARLAVRLPALHTAA